MYSRLMEEWWEHIYTGMYESVIDLRLSARFHPVPA